MNQRLISIILLLFMAIPSCALASGADMQSLSRLMEATRSQGYEQAKTHVTERSFPLFDRLWKQGVPLFFPQNVTLVKEKTQGEFRYVWVRPEENPRAGTLILAFADEDGQAKLDLPETFRNGLGEDWPKTLDMLEQAYLMTRAQVGDEAALAMVQNMLRGGAQR